MRRTSQPKSMHALLTGGAILVALTTQAAGQAVTHSANVAVSGSTVTITADGMSFSTPQAPAPVSTILSAGGNALLPIASQSSSPGSVSFSGGPLAINGSSGSSGNNFSAGGSVTVTPPSGGLPGLPSLPGQPSLPGGGLPSLPSVPGLGSLSTAALPNLPVALPANVGSLSLPVVGDVGVLLSSPITVPGGIVPPIAPPALPALPTLPALPIPVH